MVVDVSLATCIKRFHSRDQQPCKSVRTKEDFAQEKSSTPPKLLWYIHQPFRRFIALEHQYGLRDVM